MPHDFGESLKGRRHRTPFMYTLHMSRTLRTLGVGFALWWAILPQLACFLPREMPSTAESDCCKHMAGACGDPSMQSHKCCGDTRRPDLAMAPKTFREAAPDVAIPVAANPFEALAAPPSAIASGFLTGDIHAPPRDPSVSSLTLRI